jgi:hypothetical protein
VEEETMFSTKKWSAMAAAAIFAALVGQTGLRAQETTLPKDGKALATELGLSQDASTQLMPNLDKLASALERHDAMRKQALAVRTDLHDALTSLMPTLSTEQRQQLMGLMRGQWMADRGMGQGMHPGMGQGMHAGMGRGMHRGMGMGPGAHPGMRGSMGPGMGPGMRGAGPEGCPYYGAPPQSTDSTAAGGTPQGR